VISAPRHVGWFELFYDLVIVAAVSYTGHTFAAEPTWGLGLWIAAWTLIMFVLWLLTTLGNNLVPTDSAVRRMLGLLQMLAIVVAALGTVADEGLSNATGFGALALAFASVCVTYGLLRPEDPRVRRHVRALAWASGVAAGILALGLLLPDSAEWTLTGAPTWIITGGVGAAAVPLVVVVGRCAGLMDAEHLRERLGQLVIIVLGEAFIGLVTTLGGLSSIPNPVYFVLTFLVVFAIWTLYFSSVMPAGVPAGAGRLRSWLLMHVLLMFGAIGAAGVFSSLTLVAFGAGGDDVHLNGEWTTLPLFFVLVAIACMTWIAAGRLTVLVRVNLAGAGLLLLVAVIGLLVTAGGGAWENIVGSMVLIGSAIAAVRIGQPYAQPVVDGVTPAVGGTPPPGSDPSP
jgi:low temperature requirement protein LtrA